MSVPPSGSKPDALKRVSSGAAPLAGSANASITGKPGSGTSMLNAIDFVASTLPALSTERYSTVCAPSAVTSNVDANGLEPAVLVFFTQSPWTSPVFTRYSVKSTPDGWAPDWPAATTAVPVMPDHVPPLYDECSLQRNVQVPVCVSVLETEAPPGNTMPLVTCWTSLPAGSGLAPGA